MTGCIVGWAHTPFGRHEGRDVEALMLQVIDAALQDAGVDASQIVVEAHGAADSKTAAGDLDGYAFDRRVTVKIEHDGSDTAVARR